MKSLSVCHAFYEFMSFYFNVLVIVFSKHTYVFTAIVDQNLFILLIAEKYYNFPIKRKIAKCSIAIFNRNILIIISGARLIVTSKDFTPFALMQILIPYSLTVNSSTYLNDLRSSNAFHHDNGRANIIKRKKTSLN